MATMEQIIIFLSAALMLTKAEPTCKNIDQTSIVCSPSNGRDYKLVRGLVSDNNITTRVTLRGCGISYVENESFNDLTELIYLDLSQNRIKKLKQGVLDDSKQLIYLNLSHNQLTTLPSKLFDQTSKIKLLDLKENKINNLELGIFDSLHDLAYLDLSGNDLLGKDIDAFIFNQSKHITKIDFSRNNMAGAAEGLLDGFDSLEILKLDKCSLYEVPTFALKSNLETLKKLILSNNYITWLNQGSIFKNLEGLIVLDLSNNNIESINGKVFSMLKELQKVDLRNNKLKKLANGLFENLPKLIEIDLQGNQLERIPKNVFSGCPLDYLNLSHNQLTYLADDFCLDMKLNGSRLMKFHFDSNPWQCSCLLELIREVKLLDIEYNSVLYNGKDSVCMFYGTLSCMRDPLLGIDNESLLPPNFRS